MRSFSYETDGELDNLIPSISNWGRWGDQDQLGTLNFITPDKIVTASKLVESGLSVSLAREAKITKLEYNQDLRSGDYSMNKQALFCNDFVGMRFHGWNYTHIDALCHIYTSDGQLYNNFSTDNIEETGVKALGVEHMSEKGITGRGVLLDVASFRGEKLKPGEVISLSELKETADHQGTTIQSGDILLVRSGTGTRNSREKSSGIHPESIPWLHEKEVSVLGNDGVSDFLPSNYTKYILPLHRILIPYMGMPMIDNAELDKLAEVCKKFRRWEFMLTTAPWRITNTTGSPVNPIAIF